MTTEDWVASVHRVAVGQASERYEMSGDPSYIWEQCGFWLSDTAVHRITLERTTPK